MCPPVSNPVSTTIAQVSAGAATSGLLAAFTNPAFAPVFGALAALLVALIQYAIRHVNTKGKLPEDSAAIQAAVAAAVVAALESKSAHRDATDARRDAIPPPPRVPRIPPLPLLALVALATGGCAAHPRLSGWKGPIVWHSERFGKCVGASVDVSGGADNGGATVSAHTCVRSGLFGPAAEPAGAPPPAPSAQP